MVTKKPRERYREDVRAAILDAARGAFSTGGFESVSIRSIAEMIGLSHGTIYLYFQDKEAVFDALVKESFDQLAEALQRIGARYRNDPVKLLRQAGRAYVQFGVENPGAYEFAFILRRAGQPAAKPHLAYEYLRGAVQRCIDEKRFAARDADVASQALWTAVHGITSLLILRPAFPWKKKEKVIATVVDSAVDGLLKRR